MDTTIKMVSQSLTCFSHSEYKHEKKSGICLPEILGAIEGCDDGDVLIEGTGEGCDDGRPDGNCDGCALIEGICDG